MNEFKEIPATPKNGTEVLTNNGIATDYKLLDFWRWSVSDILSNATRGRFAEFSVGSAIGINPFQLRNEWDAYDLISDTGIKIEVKSAAYIQSWNQNQLSKISFSIKKARYWYAANNILHPEPKRHADIYVFCHLKHTDQSTINPLKMEQWDFYVLPALRLDTYQRSQSSITLNSLRKLTEAKGYGELKSEIERTFREQEMKVD